MEEHRFDVVFIGGGPAGYVGAIRAAQLGMRVACIERDQLGGICLNLGCIPTKALLAAAEFFDRLRHDAADWGIHVEKVSHDWSQLVGRSRRVVDTLGRGIAALLKKNEVTTLQGTARVVAPGRVEMAVPSGSTETVCAPHVVIATGARPRGLPDAAFDGRRIVSYREAMVLPEQPERLIIVGAGAIGMEFAYFFHAFGSDVVMVEMMDHLLPNEDEEVSKAMEKAWRKRKIQCYTSTRTHGIVTTDRGIQVTITGGNDTPKAQTLSGDVVLVAIGVEANIEGLFDPSLAIEVEHGHIRVDRKTYATSVPGLYAVGDVIGPPWLAHVASEEAVVCVETIAGHEPGPIDYAAIPGCTYCQPQVGSLGLTEQACRANGLPYKVGRFPFQASGKAQAIGATEGFVKILADPVHGEILGVHMIGESVTELLAEVGVAKRMEATVDELISTIHAHPTLSEAIHEAALGVAGRTIHF